MSRVTLRTAPPTGSWSTLTLTALRVTLVRDGAFRVTLTGDAAVDSEAIGSWSALVTAASNHIRFTQTLPAPNLTLTTEGALRVTLTGQRPLVHDG